MRKIFSIIILLSLTLVLSACQTQVQEEVVAPIPEQPVEQAPVEEVKIEAPPVIEVPKEEIKVETEPVPAPIIQTPEKQEVDKLVEGDILASGSFRSQFTPGIAPTFGKVQIIKKGDGHYLQLTGFSTGEAKELYLRFAKNHQIKSVGDYRLGYLEVGELKNFEGSQQYTLPLDFDIRQWSSISIFSKYNSAVHANAVLER